MGVVAASAILLAVGMGPATAGGYHANGVKIRSGASTSHTALGVGNVGHGAKIHRTQAGGFYTYQGANGPVGDTSWDYHTNTSTGVVGYSAAYYVFP